MRHFSQLSDRMVGNLFLHAPEEFGDHDARELLAVGLGATLYMPATRPGLAATIRRRAADGVRSMVLDLEDSVGDNEVESALANVRAALVDLGQTEPPPAMVFVRVRTAATIPLIAECHAHGALTGFVVPKFTASTGPAFLDATAEASNRLRRPLFAMPILESTRLVHRETRDQELCDVATLLDRYREHILAVRVGGTDLCGTYGIRRDRAITIYDVRVVADVIADVVNHFGRTDRGFVITGPVWEYYSDHQPPIRPPLYATTSEMHDSVRFQHQSLGADLDGLLREVVLDRANGLQGKTVIHPSHVSLIHAFSAVTHEEYSDALDIASSTEGACASRYRNKMNEEKPHRRWAEQTLLRAKVFGVINRDVTLIDLLAALTWRASVS